MEISGSTALVTGLVLGATDTDMMVGFDLEKNDPADIVRIGLDGLEAGELEILADEESVRAKAALSVDPSVVFRDQLDSLGG